MSNEGGIEQRMQISKTEKKKKGCLLSCAVLEAALVAAATDLDLEFEALVLKEALNVVLGGRHIERW